DEQIEFIVKKIKELADKQKEVMREDIIAIANDVTTALTKDEQIVILDEVKVTTGNKTNPTATVRLRINNEEKIGEGVGVGPVDAVSKAIQSLVNPNITLKEYNLKAITGGTDALANVVITVADSHGNIFKAEGVNEDVIMASATALVKGLNKALGFKRVKEAKSKESTTII
ncbi:MAG: alpha-isopropylmalate synthase regulatory domain-containing protein, partial [Nanoarchaeota archaeon]